MPFRIAALALSAGLVALASPAFVRTVPHASALTGIQMAQTTQTKQATERAKHKTKKKKSRKSANPQPVHGGQPDPGKY
jgi:hypothetical protein